VLLAHVVAHVAGFVPTDEQRLLDKLLDGYNPASRPVYNASHQVVVKFGITLAQIQDMVRVTYSRVGETTITLCYCVSTRRYSTERYN